MLEHLKDAVSLSYQISTLYSTPGGLNEIEKFCKYTLYKIGKAVEILHQADEAHGDLKASNILCDVDEVGSTIRIVTKATAFSNKHLREYLVSNTQGVPYWVTPELIEQEIDEVPTKAGDVWAFGCLAY